MRVALVIPGHPANKPGQRFRRILRSPPPLGVAWIAGQLREAGHDVRVVDQFREGLSADDVAARLADHRSEAVGLSLLSPDLRPPTALLAAIRNRLPNIRTFAGNAFASEYPAQVLGAGGFDAVVHGEGEEVTVDLLAAWEGGNDLGAVAGASWQGPQGAERNRPRAAIRDLDALARPAWDLMPRYVNEVQWLVPEDVPVLAVQAARGCPWKCGYCAQNFLRDDVRRRDPAAVAAEVRWLHDRFGVRHFGLVDSIFPLTRADGLAFAQGLIDQKLAGKVRFLLQTRTDLVDPEAFRALADVGLHLAYLGIETASDETLAKVGKNGRIEEARRSVKLLQGLGVNVYGLYMMGLPGESMEDMRRTVDTAIELGTDVASFSRTTPYPGSPTDRAEKLVLDPRYRDSHDNWDTVSDAPVPGSAYTVRQIAVMQRWAMFRFYVRPRRIARALLRREFSLRTMIVGALPLLAGGLLDSLRRPLRRDARGGD
jgi:radical SAM superfamily enzyme YgiQ (UPF0313 family)